MRSKFLPALCVVALLVVAPPPDAIAQAAMIEGVVTKVDPAAGKITLRHGPVKKFDMDMPMTMVFRVPDAAMLKGLKAGDKVKFDADKVNGQYTVTVIEKAK
jgi:Cu/Ag efflux protein CusF